MIGRYRCREPENFRASIRSSDLVQIEANFGAFFFWTVQFNSIQGVGGGEIGALMHSVDWSKMAIGPLERWSSRLQMMVSISWLIAFRCCSGGQISIAKFTMILFSR
jgi:hypothetical protein